LDGEENEQKDARPTLPADKIKRTRVRHKGCGIHA
jgi:hypothetical protein